ncbi:hypothetical protein DL768_002986 [Monosporascus sp. mg162]|nr:hypothetical protein DL768_002986 [Monosporascus sp. mg162]
MAGNTTPRNGIQDSSQRMQTNQRRPKKHIPNLPPLGCGGGEYDPSKIKPDGGREGSTDVTRSAPIYIPERKQLID